MKNRKRHPAARPVRSRLYRPRSERFQPLDEFQSLYEEPDFAEVERGLVTVEREPSMMEALTTGRLRR